VSAVRVLLVEDNYPLADSITRALEVNGISVEWAATIHEARVLYEPNKYDMILSDYELPDGNALDDFLFHIAGSDKAFIVLWSGYERSAELLASGQHVDLLLTKGVSAIDEILVAVERIQRKKIL
jgi:DNA-binding response OmpR family regulator